MTSVRLQGAHLAMLADRHRLVEFYPCDDRKPISVTNLHQKPTLESRLQLGLTLLKRPSKSDGARAFLNLSRVSPIF